MSDIDCTEWRCPACNELVDVDLDVCWNCGTDRDGVRDPTFGSRHDSPEDAAGDRQFPWARLLLGLACAFVAIASTFLLFEIARGDGWMDDPLALVATITVAMTAAYFAARVGFGQIRHETGTSEAISDVSERPTSNRKGVWTCPDCGATNPETLLRCWKCAPTQRVNRSGESTASETEAAEQTPFPLLRPPWFGAKLALGSIMLLIAGVFCGVFVAYREISERPQDADMIFGDIGEMAIRVIVIFAVVSVLAVLFRRRH